MIITAEEAVEKSLYAGCTIWEYPFKSEALNIAKAHITKRYPEHGRALNTGCEEVYYVLEGAGTIWIGEEESSIKPGDVCVIPKGFAYAFEGNAVLLISTSPPWSPAQHQIVEL